MSEEKNIESEDHTWKMYMQTLMKRKKNMEIAQTINDAIEGYYLAQSKPVPNWRQDRNPQWWIDYLISLGIDPNNT